MLDGNGPVADVCAKVPNHPNCVVIGDATGDGVADFDDFAALLGSPLYETGECATFEQGDFNLDGELNSSDLVVLFQNLGNTELTFIPGFPREACPPPDQAAVGARAAALDKSEETDFRPLDSSHDLVEHSLNPRHDELLESLGTNIREDRDAVIVDETSQI